MLSGLDLFSGIGGLTLALAPWVRPAAYCEIDRYATAVLLSRQADGALPAAPVWDDVRTLRGDFLPPIDIIYGGFPCQDISIAGAGKGLAGERSGLVREIFRLVDETRPRFVFLENVPAIRTRGADVVTSELAARGYDCRWTLLSAAEIGAPHRRERWWLLAYRNDVGREIVASTRLYEKGARGHNIDILCAAVSDPDSSGLWHGRQRHPQRHTAPSPLFADDGSARCLADATGAGQVARGEQETGLPIASECGWWEVEPNVGRVADGVPKRVDRLRALGNAVVPAQARAAFRLLMFGNADGSTPPPDKNPTGEDRG